MKTIKLSMAALATFATVSIVEANSLADALKNGKTTGDISITYEKRKQEKEISAYYSNTAYSVASVGINYKTADFNNFSGSVGFRAYNTLYEADKNFQSNHGTGDASERFYEGTGSAMLAEGYLAYDKNSTHIKLGRQSFYNTEWIEYVNDAVSMYTSPIENSVLELIWTNRFGRAYARDLRPMQDVNGEEGMYSAAFTYTFNDNIKTKVYALKAPKSHDIYGAKVNLDTTFDNGSMGTLIHAMETNEKATGAKDGEMIELRAYTTIAGYTATLGYVKTGKENGWGSAANAGDIVVPFEEGDQMYAADSQTTYLMLSKSVADVGLTALYGITKYGQYEKDEFNLWAGYDVVKNTNLAIGYAFTNEDKDDAATTDLQQINATVTYKF